jgi:hypothetical protein
MSYIVQSVVLKRSKLTRREADAWIHKHGYKLTAPDITREFMRYRQMDPARLHAFRFRTIDLGDVGYLIVAYYGPETTKDEPKKEEEEEEKEEEEDEDEEEEDEETDEEE